MSQENKIEKVVKEISDLFFMADEFYADYIRIHDECHKFSLRKIIPIPFIFKPINYKAHTEELSRILDELKKIELKMKHIIKENRKDIQNLGLKDWVNMFIEYVGDFWMMLSKLKSITDRLAEQSEGIRKFPYKEHSRMLDEYQRESCMFQTSRETVHNYISNSLKEHKDDLIKEMEEAIEGIEDKELEKLSPEEVANLITLRRTRNK
jgi:hypothetical protein